MKKSFTLVEVIIAIIVFGIGILTILATISKNIQLSDTIKNKTFATFLAREGLEIVYNKRDTNIDRGVVWNCFRMNANYDCVDKFEAGKYYKSNVSLTGYSDISLTNSGYDDNQIYFHTGFIKNSANVPVVSGFWYSYDPSGTKTVFSRYIFFDGAYLAPEGGIGNTDKLLKIQSHGIYRKGSYTGEVVLESFVGER